MQVVHSFLYNTWYGCGGHFLPHAGIFENKAAKFYPFWCLQRIKHYWRICTENLYQKYKCMSIYVRLPLKMQLCLNNVSAIFKPIIILVYFNSSRKINDYTVLIPFTSLLVYKTSTLKTLRCIILLMLHLHYKINNNACMLQI